MALDDDQLWEDAVEALDYYRKRNRELPLK
jgi:hypothetical protein